MTFSIPDPQAFEFVMTTRCALECDHCLFICGPDRNEIIKLGDVRECLADLGELGFRQLPIVLGGGEPFLVFPELVDTVLQIRRASFQIAYAETGAGSFVSADEVLPKLIVLREAGLPRIFISTSPFHQTAVSPRLVREFIRICSLVFGPDGVIHNTLGLLEHVARISGSQPLPTRNFIDAVGPAHFMELLRRHNLPLMLIGRAPYALRPFLPHSPLESLEEECLQWLFRGQKWNFGPNPRIQTGFCVGISFPAQELSRWYRNFRLKDWPVVEALATKGLRGLVDLAALEARFEPDPRGYVSACHACQEIRLALWRLGRYRELGPDGFYTQLECLRGK